MKIEELPYTEKVKEEASKLYSTERAEKIALYLATSKFQKVETDWIARAEDVLGYKTVHYEMVADEASISRADDGDSYIDYVISSGSKDGHGTIMSPLFRTAMVDQINNEGLVGRVDDEKHQLFNELQTKGLSPEEIEEELQKSQSGIKAVSARLLGDKVIAKIKVAADKLADVLKYKGASIEARTPTNAFREGVVTQGRLTGFVLTNSPSNPDSFRVGISG